GPLGGAANRSGPAQRRNSTSRECRDSSRRARPADRSRLAHSAAVSPATSDERPAGAGPFDHEHAAIQVAEEPADRQLAVHAGGRPAAGDPEGTRAARNPASLDGEDLHGPDAQRRAELVHLPLGEGALPAHLFRVRVPRRRAVAGNGIETDETGDERLADSVAKR